MAIYNYIKKLIGYYAFSVVCFLYMFNPKNYNSASKEIFVKQVYDMSIKILPSFIISAIIFGAFVMGVLVSFSLQYGLKEYIGNIIVKVVLVELSPFLMALFFSLKTGLQIGVGTAVMKVNGELNTLKLYNIDIVRYIFMSKALGSMVSFLSLMFLFAIIMSISGYVFLFLTSGMGFDLFLKTFVDAISLRDIILFVSKSLLYGLIIISIPGYDGINVKKRYFEIPKSISKTMLSLFFIILFLEVVSLAIELI